MRSDVAKTGERFPSAIDSWVAVVLAIVPLISAVSLVAVIVSGDNVLVGLIGPLIVAGIYGGVLYPLYYEFESEALRIRFGFIRRRIPYSSIRAVHPTHNPLSAPALSLRRLRVDYGSGSLSFALISPARRDEFLDALAARTGLTREGDSLKRG